MYQSNTRVCGTPDFITGEEKSMVQTASKEFVHDLASVSCQHTDMSKYVAGHTLW